MIIGAIEVVRPNRVAGWIHCHAADLKDATVLAFVDRRCVGSGTVGIHRQDLQNAGLLHGELGFDFAITLASPEDVGKVVVTLERCEAVIVQRGSVVLSADSVKAMARAGDSIARLPPPEVAAWLRAQGAIGGAEAELIEGLTDYGVALWQPEDEGGPAGRAALPLKAAARLFSACAVRAMGVEAIDITDPQHLQEVLGQAAAEGGPLSRAGLLAFHAARPVRMRVVEGSHRQGPGADPASVGDPATTGLEYPVGPDGLLLLHRDCRFAVDEFTPNRRLRLLVPVPQPED